ncbi:hypothetical protein Taro_046352 [Colocasia esculenta]|uniref:glutathione-disulfide reductase n=1 Tax=Colocasia esculenta TaxID=4460 RepID=A0A843X610_COLES|nr:hypothetical protein [Colocasia esculenta]
MSLDRITSTVGNRHHGNYSRILQTPTQRERSFPTSTVARKKLESRTTGSVSGRSDDDLNGHDYLSEDSIFFPRFLCVASASSVTSLPKGSWQTLCSPVGQPCHPFPPPFFLSLPRRTLFPCARLPSPVTRNFPRLPAGSSGRHEHVNFSEDACSSVLLSPLSCFVSGVPRSSSRRRRIECLLFFFFVRSSSAGDCAKMSRKMLIDGDASHAESDQQYDYDLFVIGAGSGGVRASRTSAGYGAKVAICELPFHPISSEVIGGVGGTCVIRGCVPKKILVYGSSFRGEFEDAKNFGWELNGEVGFNWKKLLHNKTQEIVRLNGIYKRLLTNAGVTMLEGEGKIVDPHVVELTQPDGSKQQYSAKHILIATGSRAQRANIPGKELAITSDEALSLDELPKHAVILGGGYIAVEFASIWRGMGVTVDLFYRKELPLRGFDDEMRSVVARNLEGRGIRLHPGTSLSELNKTEDGIRVLTDKGEELIADVVLFATGKSLSCFYFDILSF